MFMSVEETVGGVEWERWGVWNCEPRAVASTAPLLMPEMRLGSGARHRPWFAIRQGISFLPEMRLGSGARHRP
jgi:hypothetical protein